MQLVIAEKPSVANSIADVLGANDRKDGYREGNGYLVSWCVGHLIELSQPQVYGEQYEKWDFNTLPIIPENWQYEVKPDTKKQFDVVKKLMNKPLAKVEEMEEQNYNQIDNVLNNGFEQKKEEKEKEARGEDKSDKRPSLKKRLEEKKEQVASEPGKPVPEKDKTKSNRRSLLGE